MKTHAFTIIFLKKCVYPSATDIIFYIAVVFAIFCGLYFYIYTHIDINIWCYWATTCVSLKHMRYFFLLLILTHMQHIYARIKSTHLILFVTILCGGGGGACSQVFLTFWVTRLARFLLFSICVYPCAHFMSVYKKKIVRSYIFLFFLSFLHRSQTYAWLVFAVCYQIK